MTVQELHDEKVRDLAESYRHQGYEVVVAPPPNAIPGFDSSLRPDLLARKDRDQIVIEVKSRSGLRNSDAVRRMADALAKKIDWRFELVVLEDDAMEPNQTLSAEFINAHLSSAELLLRQGQTAASFALVWICVEATLRKLASAHRLELEDASPIRLIRELSFHGLLSREDFDSMNEMLQLRNQIVHGFAAPALSAQNVEQLLDLARRLIASCESATAAA